VSEKVRLPQTYLGLFEDGDNLAVGVTGRLHAELSKIILRKFYS
jgi:hypothetical protein